MKSTSHSSLTAAIRKESVASKSRALRNAVGFTLALGACLASADQSTPAPPRGESSPLLEPTALNVPATLDQFDRDKDGALSRDEARHMTPLLRAFPRLDKNRDGRLDARELRRATVMPED